MPFKFILPRPICSPLSASSGASLYHVAWPMGSVRLSECDNGPAGTPGRPADGYGILKCASVILF